MVERLFTVCAAALAVVGASASVAVAAPARPANTVFFASTGPFVLYDTSTGIALACDTVDLAGSDSPTPPPLMITSATFSDSSVPVGCLAPGSVMTITNISSWAFNVTSTVGGVAQGEFAGFDVHVHDSAGCSFDLEGSPAASYDGAAMTLDISGSGLAATNVSSSCDPTMVANGDPFLVDSSFQG
ncbi:hypothetical protein [Actinomadura atramentaria]|uniref:hypothetical protein n=1 Tax=Actinomadura atramentaria TaxID=1990 RepID=UPI0003711694|nr:hypothetical protein [Actinomadura atramentaria]